MIYPCTNRAKIFIITKLKQEFFYCSFCFKLSKDYDYKDDLIFTKDIEKFNKYKMLL